MILKRFFTKGFCMVCKKDVQKCEIWLMQSYYDTNGFGGKVKVDGGAHLIAYCHDKRDERSIEYCVGTALVDGWIDRVAAPFFNPEHKAFVPMLDRGKVGLPRGPKKKISKAEQERIAYEKMFSPKPTPKKGSRHGCKIGRDRELCTKPGSANGED